MITDSDIYNTINDVFYESSVPKDNEIWVSELTGCLRESWYKRLVGVRATKKMVEGLIAHSTLLPFIAERLGCIYEVRVEYSLGKYVLVGRADIVCDDRVIELKVSDSPVIKDEYRLQANAYAYILGKPRYTIVVLSDDINMKTFKTSEKLFKVILNRAKTYIRYVELSIEPPREESSRCRYCFFRRVCFSDEGLEKFM